MRTVAEGASIAPSDVEGPGRPLWVPCDVAETRSWVVSAARAGALRPWAQPIFASDDQLAACEVLARCPFPDGSLRTPDHFAHALGQSPDWWHLDSAMLVEAAAMAAGSSELFGAPVQVAWNTASTSLDDGYVDLIRATIVEHGLEPSQLCLELTEHVPLGAGRAIETLREIRATGVHLALDDIGESPSLLRALRSVGFDIVKLDRPLVAELDTDRGTRLVGNLIRLVHDLGARVVAEGIESDEMHHRLQDLGCDLFQGNHLGPAMPLDSFVRTRHRSPHAPG